MDTTKLKKFATMARTTLLEQVGTRLRTVLAEGSLARRESSKAVSELESKIRELGENRVLETVAYTWFNRFCALRYMDANHYTRIGVLSPAEGQFQPEILAEAKMGHIDEELVPESTRARVLRLLDGTDPSSDPQGEAYRLLLVAVCNHYHTLMPFMFEKIADYTELLLPDDLLSENSIPHQTREAISSADTLPPNESAVDTLDSKSLNRESVEVIGWLYQFYISEKKDAIFDGLRKNQKITPENIPAATQLFTPHWIVRYLVQNSLGRLWMLNHPNSKLIDQMEYYIPSEGPDDDYLTVNSLEELKICDPACGSGHMLTYAFDLLYAMYEEEGYPPNEIPSNILNYNLYGIELDERAGALAAFALVMKAREKDNRFFSRKPKLENSSSKITIPNICVLESVAFSPDELDDYMHAVGSDLFTQGLRETLTQFYEADNFGSLIVPKVSSVSNLLATLESKDLNNNLFLAETHQRVLLVLRMVEYLSQRYAVVIANPPYMGGKGMNARLSAWAKDNYPISKSDLFAMFIERNLEFAVHRGTVAMITMQSWMFLSSFEALRNKILGLHTILSMAHLGAKAFDSIGGEVVSTTAFVLEKTHKPDYRGAYIRLVDGNSESEKMHMLAKALKQGRSI